MKRLAAAVALCCLVLLCLAACGGSPDSGGAAPSPTGRPTSSPEAIRELSGRWHNPNVDFEYYLNFTNEDTVLVAHTDPQTGNTIATPCRFRAHDGHLVITTITEEDEGATILFHYRYTITGDLLELEDLTGTGHKTLRRVR